MTHFKYLFIINTVLPSITDSNVYIPNSDVCQLKSVKYINLIS